MPNLIISILLTTAPAAQSELDKPYFGVELIDSRGAVVIENVDLDHRTAKKLKPNHVVLSVNNQTFKSAQDMQTWLDQRKDRESVRFELLGKKDSKPEKVSVRAESLRTLLPRRFTKERDRNAKQILHIPRLSTSNLHVAVAESFDGKTIGIRLRYFPRLPAPKPSSNLVFWGERTNPLLGQGARIKTKPAEFHYSGLSEEEEKKLPTLSAAEMRKVNLGVYIELNTDRTTELLKVLRAGTQKDELVRISYLTPGEYSMNLRTLTVKEKRNIRSCLLLHELLTNGKTPPSKPTQQQQQQPANTQPPGQVVGGWTPSQTALTKAVAGWKLWQAGKYSGGTGDGFYTDPDSSTQVKDFWSNGAYARVDDTDDGMFETIFKIEKDKLIYIGTLERPFIFKRIVAGHEQTVKTYLQELRARNQGR